MKPVKDFPGYYIAENGQVYSEKYGDLRKLKPSKNSGGYYNVILRKNGKSVSRSVHRLVAENYIENLDNALEVDHIDRNKLNNNADNLRWVSRSENLKNRVLPDDFKEKMCHLSFERSRRKDGTFLN